MDDLNDLLSRSNAFHHLDAERRLTNAIHKFPDDLEVHVGLKKGETDFAQSVLNIGLGELGTAAESAEDSGESVCQTFKHDDPYSCGLELRTVTQLSLSSQAKSQLLPPQLFVLALRP